MPRMKTGYYTNKEGVTVEQELYEADLNEACNKFPSEWSKSPPAPKAPEPEEKSDKLSKKGS